MIGALASRLRPERGAVAVFVALGMVVLLGFAAVAIDTSAARRDQQVLRNAADAAALAVAMECAKAVAADMAANPTATPATDCPVTAATAKATADRLGSDNAGSSSTVKPPLLQGQTVTVTVEADASRPIPIGPGKVRMTSKAAWTTTIGYTASYPLAISYCRYLQLPEETPYHLASEPNGLELLPDRQEISPADWTGSDTCDGPTGSLTFPVGSVMTLVDDSAACGSSSAKDRNVTGQAFEPVTFAARTCVASSQFGDVTSWPHGGYEIVVPVYDEVHGNRYHVSDYLGFHVMGVDPDGGLWGFSTGPVDPALGTPMPSVRLTT
ncbi:pilus assembly protein TadG-related protein [Modestobacter altitudinis]|uniref:pilus assembly protein TadG-related protein n=1 Tax=Modestobacter altitudinis TaxID=2213158 RepID=UPI001486C848|nr:pilus assembly protein TadG-related protein [Modestobacter altitudinis]